MTLPWLPCRRGAYLSAVAHGIGPSLELESCLRIRAMWTLCRMGRGSSASNGLPWPARPLYPNAGAGQHAGRRLRDAVPGRDLERSGRRPRLPDGASPGWQFRVGGSSASALEGGATTARRRKRVFSRARRGCSPLAALGDTVRVTCSRNPTPPVHMSDPGTSRRELASAVSIVRRRFQASRSPRTHPASPALPAAGP